MRITYLISLLGALLIASSVTAAAGSREAELSKRQETLYQQILGSSKGFVDVGTADFQSIVHVPRDYAITALLTTTDVSIKCPPCIAFQPVFGNLARSWNKNKDKKKNVFIKVEFAKAKEIFKLFQLQHAPALFIFPASSPSNPTPDPIIYDFNRFGFEGDEVAAFISKTIGTEFKYAKPLNYKMIAMTGTALIVVASTVVFVAPRVSLVMKSSKPIWMVLCLATMIVFTSGQMWNQIRGAPYIAVGQDGKPQYFASGFQNQYGAETHIVAAVYALLAFSFVALMVLVPAQRDPTRQRAGVYVWSAIFLGVFSLLLAIFRMKNPSYPFRIFF